MTGLLLASDPLNHVVQHTLYDLNPGGGFFAFPVVSNHIIMQVFAAVLDGVGGFVHSFQLPSRRVGDTGELRIGIGDMNRDGVPDLVLASTGTTRGDLVRTLFGSRR